MKIYNYFINITGGIVSLEFRLKNIEKIRNYFIKGTDQHELMSIKNKNVFTPLNYI